MKNSKFRIIYISVNVLGYKSKNAARKEFESQSDDYNEFSLGADFLEAKLQERVNIAMPHENNGKPIWVWRDCE